MADVKREQRFLSGNTVFRSVTPKNEEQNKFQINFDVDYKTQSAVVPDGFVTGLSPNSKLRTMNKTGRSALGLLTDPLGASDSEKGVF